MHRERHTNANAALTSKNHQSRRHSHERLLHGPIPCRPQPAARPRINCAKQGHRISSCLSCDCPRAFRSPKHALKLSVSFTSIVQALYAYSKARYSHKHEAQAPNPATMQDDFCAEELNIFKLRSLQYLTSGDAIPLETQLLVSEASQRCQSAAGSLHSTISS